MLLQLLQPVQALQRLQPDDDDGGDGVGDDGGDDEDNGGNADSIDLFCAYSSPYFLTNAAGLLSAGERVWLLAFSSFDLNNNCQIHFSFEI